MVEVENNPKEVTEGDAQTFLASYPRQYAKINPKDLQAKMKDYGITKLYWGFKLKLNLSKAEK